MSHFFRVETGTIAAEDEPGKTLLGEREGRYYLTPSSPDLILFVRSPPAGGPTPQPRVVLAGDLSGFSLADLVAFLHQSRRNGVLRVVASNGERAIVLKEGEVRGAGSDDPADRIGEVAVRLGYVQRKDLDVVMQEDPPASRVGRILVDRRLMAPHDLWKCVQHQVSEIFHSILLAREGAFLLVDQEIEDRSTALALNTQALLMDGIRRIDEMAEFRKRLPSSHSYLIQRKPAGVELEAEERRLYELCEGDRTVAQVAKAARLSEFEATKVLYHLAEGGYVAASELPRASAPEKKAGPQEVAQVFNSIFKAIRDEAHRKGKSEGFLQAANAALEGEASARSPVLSGLSFGHDGTLDLEQLLQNLSKTLGPGSEATNVLRNALAEVMFFLLFQAGEILDPKSDEELGKRVKELLSTIDEG